VTLIVSKKERGTFLEQEFGHGRLVRPTLRIVSDTPVHEPGKRDPCAVFFRPLYFPSSVPLDQPHLASSSPPVVHIPWAGNPKICVAPQVSEMSKKGRICFSGAGLYNVIGMDDEVRRAVIFENQLNLLFPEVRRVLLQNVEQRVVLRYGHRNLEDSADEERFRGAAAARLRIEVSDIRYGHVIRKIECAVPVEIPVENT
jgi:hypothetical protein